MTLLKSLGRILSGEFHDYDFLHRTAPSYPGPPVARAKVTEMCPEGPLEKRGPRVLWNTGQQAGMKWRQRACELLRSLR